LLAHALLVIGLASKGLCIHDKMHQYTFLVLLQTPKEDAVQGTTRDCTYLILRQDFLEHYNLSFSHPTNKQMNEHGARALLCHMVLIYALTSHEASALNGQHQMNIFRI